MQPGKTVATVELDQLFVQRFDDPNMVTTYHSSIQIISRQYDCEHFRILSFGFRSRLNQIQTQTGSMSSRVT